MKTPQQIRNEVEKYEIPDFTYWTPECEKEYKKGVEDGKIQERKSIKEMIDKLEKEYREAEIKQKGICPNVKEMTDGALIVLDRLREELSKIGGVDKC